MRPSPASMGIDGEALLGKPVSVAPSLPCSSYSDVTCGSLAPGAWRDCSGLSRTRYARRGSGMGVHTRSYAVRFRVSASLVRLEGSLGLALLSLDIVLELFPHASRLPVYMPMHNGSVSESVPPRPATSVPSAVERHRSKRLSQSLHPKCTSQSPLGQTLP